jgi:hypothetical protein
MGQHFAVYFTSQDAWKSCDVVELGIYNTEKSALQAGLQSALQHPGWNLHSLQNLRWTRLPWGLVAKTPFGRYDIREVAAG